MIEVTTSIDLGVLAARAIIVAVYGVITLVSAGVEAIDEAIEEKPVVGAPAPHDSDDAVCLFLCGFTLDVRPADTRTLDRFSR